MNVGNIKQLIRQRCRLDPRLTDAYMLEYAREAVMNISSGRVFKRNYDLVLVDGTATYDLRQFFIDIDFIEYGTADNFTHNSPLRLVKGIDYTITKDTTDTITGIVSMPKIHFTFMPDATKTIRIHYSALLEDILANTWSANSNTLDQYMQREACLALIIYVAYQHKRNYQKDMLSQFDKEEFENAKLDLERLYNERVENP